MRNLIANLPLYLGLAARMLGDRLFDLSFKLHISLGTESGKKLAELQKAANELVQAMKEAKAAGGRASGDSKLYDIISGGTGGKFTLGKKPSDN